MEYGIKTSSFGDVSCTSPNSPPHLNYLVSQLIPRTTLALFMFVNVFRIGRKIGCYFADSKKMPVCDNLRIKRNKVFDGIAGRSKSSTGWFYGLKLFLVINAYGEILKCLITPANIADNNLEMMKKVFKNLKGYVFADKGFISQPAFEHFYQAGLKIVTTIRRNIRTPYLAQNESALVLKINFKSDPGKMVSV